MENIETTRWTVVVSKETDIAVRTLLAQRGQKKGDLSKFIEETIKWRVFEQTWRDAQDAFTDLSQEERQALIAEVSKNTRRETRALLGPTRKT